MDYNKRGFELLEKLSAGQIDPTELSSEDKERVLTAQDFSKSIQKGANRFHYRGDYIQKYDPNINPELKGVYEGWMLEYGNWGNRINI